MINKSKIAVIILILLLVYLASKFIGTGTANLAPETITGLDTTSDNGLSPIDIGGIFLSIPSKVLSWKSLAEKYAQIHPILDPEEILAIIWNESSGEKTAKNDSDPSWGLMGVTLLIGNAYAGVTQGEQLFDPETNIKAGSAFLSHLKSTYSDRFPDTWSDGYNEGETKLNQGIILTPGYSQAFVDHVNTLKGIG